MTAVLKHELSNYFHSLTAYIFGAFLLAFVGIGAMIYNIQQAVANFEYVLSFVSLVFVVLIPVLTMRVIAEERKQKTDQLLYSLPITTTQIVVGKYLALLAVYLLPLCIVSVYPLIFARYGEVYLLTAYGSVIAFFIMAAALCVLCCLLGFVIRFLTRNEKLAYAVAIVLILVVCVTYYMDSTVFEGLLPDIMTRLSLFERFYTVVSGVFEFWYRPAGTLFPHIS